MISLTLPAHSTCLFRRVCVTAIVLSRSDLRSRVLFTKQRLGRDYLDKCLVLKEKNGSLSGETEIMEPSVRAGCLQETAFSAQTEQQLVSVTK